LVADLIALQRETTAARINQVLNHPDVRPWVADASEGVLDISPAVANRNNVLLLGEHGGCMFFKLLDGFYEVHTQVLPAGRGPWTSRMIASCFHHMFTKTDAIEILTRVPATHTTAKAKTLSVGAKHEFDRPKECVFQGKRVDVGIYSISIQEWASQADGLSEVGEWLHRRLNEEAQRLGIKDPPHEEDVNHNRYLGASFEMFRGGQPVKGAAFYNRWALVSRHAPVQLLSLAPPAVRMDIGVLKLLPNGDVQIERES
jgi:hypothetical protein